MTTSSRGLDALIVGSTFLDIVLDGLPHLPAPGEEVWARQRNISVGGVANNAIGTARLGMRTHLVTSLGTDAVGSTVSALLDQEELLSVSPHDPSVTTPLTVALTSALDRSFLSHGSIDLTQGMRAEVQALGPAVLLFVALDVEPPTWVDARRAAGAVVFAGVGWDERHGWSDAVLDNLSHVDVLVLNEAEAARYTRSERTETALLRLAESVALPVITRGARGAIAFDASSGSAISVPAVRSDVVDTTGAGDEFVAGLMRATLGGSSLLERLQFAVLCSGLSTRRLGGSSCAPTVAELRHWHATAGAAAEGYAFLPDLLAIDWREPELPILPPPPPTTWRKS